MRVNTWQPASKIYLTFNCTEYSADTHDISPATKIIRQQSRRDFASSLPSFNFGWSMPLRNTYFLILLRVSWLSSSPTKIPWHCMLEPTILGELWCPKAITSVQETSTLGRNLPSKAVWWSRSLRLTLVINNYTYLSSPGLPSSTGNWAPMKITRNRPICFMLFYPCFPRTERYFRDSQHGWGRQGPLGPPAPTSALAGLTRAQWSGPCPGYFWKSSRRRIYSLSGKPVPVLWHPHSTEVPHAQREPHVFQFLPVVSSPGARHHLKEPGFIFHAPAPLGLLDTDEIPRLLFSSWTVPTPSLSTPREGVHSPDHLDGTLLDSFQYIHEYVPPQTYQKKISK